MQVTLESKFNVGDKVVYTGDITKYKGKVYIADAIEIEATFYNGESTFFLERVKTMFEGVPMFFNAYSLEKYIPKKVFLKRWVGQGCQSSNKLFEIHWYATYEEAFKAAQEHNLRTNLNEEYIIGYDKDRV